VSGRVCRNAKTAIHPDEEVRTRSEKMA
jgi:hypothetical protein